MTIPFNFLNTLNNDLLGAYFQTGTPKFRVIMSLWRVSVNATTFEIV
jgi:hypothetical protein